MSIDTDSSLLSMDYYSLNDVTKVTNIHYLCLPHRHGLMYDLLHEFQFLMRNPRSLNRSLEGLMALVLCIKVLDHCNI